MHTRKKSGKPPADVDFGMSKTVVVRIHPRKNCFESAESEIFA
jgi:hypothetical protein